MTAPERSPAPCKGDGTQLRVLIVEDSEDDALLLLRELKRGGYKTRHERVDTPEAMEEALGRGPWEVVISDYYMPRFRAPEALALLREWGSDAPFVVVSGKVGEELAVEAMKAGAYDYIMKDNMARLCAAIERGLEEVEVRRERKRAEEKYRSIFENSTQGIFQTTTDGRIVTANPALARILGYNSPEDLMERVSDVASQLYEEPEDRAEFARLMHQQGVVSNFETRLRRKDGAMIWISLNARALRDHDGQISGYEGMGEDITERKDAEERLRRSLDRLLALHEAGRVLGSTLEPEEIGTRLLEIVRRISGLTTAVISVQNEHDQLHVWRSVGLERLWPRARSSPVVREALRAALEDEEPRFFRLHPSAPSNSEEGRLVGLCLPLRMRERTVGVLEAYGPEDPARKDVLEVLGSLASQAASALENARLYGELAERERRLEELVAKILVAQEEERRRVAYEVHDSLAQVAAAAHQHLQAFAQYHPPQSQESHEDLTRVSKLVRQTVGEARRIIADLRPTALDDFGLRSAIRLHLDTLRAEGWHISYEDNLGDDERLPAATETAIFRVVQEALNNVGKHAGTKRVDLSLERRPAGSLAPGERGRLHLQVLDYGRGFAPESLTNVGPGERIGLTSMRERIALLGGDFRIASRPGEGTLVAAEIPLLGKKDPDGKPVGGVDGG
jgi:PAS domain S-box-containing protein